MERIQRTFQLRRKGRPCEGEAQPPSELEPGDIVGEYVIVRKLGEGGFGAVYEAAHPVIGKRAAVKILHAQYSSSEEVTSRFVAEARAVNQIRHKNIVDIFSFGDLPDGRHYYVMELLEGVGLDAYLAEAKQLPLDETLPLLYAIARALSAAHEAGIAHRDLKPENVFLEVDDEGAHPKILDFGVAKLLGTGALAAHKTRSGTPIGSPRYMSPEQCRGVHVDHRTDIYAFGCMAFRMLTGSPPFDARTALELMMMHVSVPAPAMSSVQPDVPRVLDAPVLQLMAKEPSERPATMMAAYDLLTKAAEQVGVTSGNTAAHPSTILQRLIGEARAAATPAPVAKSAPRAERFGARSRRSLVGPLAWAVAAVAVVVAVGSLRASRRPPPPSGARSALSTLPTPLAPASSASASESRLAPSATPEPATVTITVQSQPAHADIYLNDEKLGTAPGPFRLPKAASAVTLVAKSPGHVATPVFVVPADDVNVNVTLSPQAPKPARGGVPRDLENPY